MTGVKIDKMDLFSRIAVSPELVLPKYIKWRDTIVGEVFKNLTVSFYSDQAIPTLKLILNGKYEWTSEDFQTFLSERVPSPNRRDIEKILQKSKMSEYNVFRLAAVTRAFHSRDLLWLSNDENEKFDDTVPQVFKSVFMDKRDLVGDSVLSPEGLNVKRYGVSNGSYGIYKERLHPSSSDAEAEVAVYHLSKLLGVRCCPAWLTKGTRSPVCFSKFEYNFSQEFIVHLRRLFADGERTDHLYDDLMRKLPEFSESIEQMIVLDFVTRQTDRHLSNAALLVSDDSVSFYPLYDNGRSLFFEDNTQMIIEAIKDVQLYSTEFGEVGTYYDAITDIAKTKNIKSLVNLDINEKHITDSYASAGLSGERLEGSVKWTMACLDLLKRM